MGTMDLRIHDYKNIHAGEDIFVIGTAESLNNVDMPLLRDKITIGVNTLYLGFDEWGFEATYMCLADKIILIDYGADIMRLKMPLFFGWLAAGEFLGFENYYKRFGKADPVLIGLKGDLIVDDPEWKDKDLSKGHYGCNAIMLDVGVQLAYWMGAKNIYLLGIDLPNSGGHYFYGDFPHAGMPTKRFCRPNGRVIKAAAVMDRSLREEGKVLYNCTPGGNLTGIERVSLGDAAK